jgi:methyl-accepting chemotaxis protein
MKEAVNERKSGEEEMSQTTLRTKFVAGFSALLQLPGALAFTSVRAMNALNSELESVVHMWTRADRTSQLESTLAELAGYQQALLLRTVLSDTSGAEWSRTAAANAEARLGASFAELIPTLDSAQDRDLVAPCKRKPTTHVTLALRRMLAELNNLTGEVAQGAQQVALAASQMNTVSDSLTEGATQQSAPLVSIDATGSVESVKPLTGNPALAGTAVNTVKRRRFEPILSDGKPVRAVAVLSFSFQTLAETNARQEQYL